MKRDSKLKNSAQSRRRERERECVGVCERESEREWVRWKVSEKERYKM